MVSFGVSIERGGELAAEISRRADERSAGWGRVPVVPAESVGVGFSSLGLRLAEANERLRDMGRAGAERFDGYSSGVRRQIAGFSGVDRSFAGGLRGVVAHGDNDGNGDNGGSMQEGGR